MDQFDLLKSHIDAYTRKDGVVVQAHDDKRAKKSKAELTAETEAKFVEHGITAMHGGRKGHGYWLGHVGHDVARSIHNGDRGALFAAAKRGQHRAILKDNPASGNEYFWRHGEATKLLGHLDAGVPLADAVTRSGGRLEDA